MNAKKAKKLRQLVKHLVEKSGMTSETQYTEQQFPKWIVPKNELDTPRQVVNVTRKLSPECARAVYKQMKGS
jgi:hypothetical protein